jgi:hypothetical protein
MVSTPRCETRASWVPRLHGQLEDIPAFQLMYPES